MAETREPREVVIGENRYRILPDRRVRLILPKGMDTWTGTAETAAVRRVAELEDALREAAEHHEEEVRLWGDDEYNADSEIVAYHRERAALLRMALGRSE